MCLEIEDKKKKKKELSGLNSPFHFTEDVDYKGVFILGFTQNSFKNSPSNIVLTSLFLLPS